MLLSPLAGFRCQPCAPWLCPDDRDDARQRRTSAGRGCGAPIKLLAPALIQLDTGYTRQLAANSVWKRVGHVPQGEVYRPVGTIFTIEGRQVHEAYLVLKDNKLVGFYLPGSKTIPRFQPQYP
ncbi:hypothetical protein ACU4GD_37915 [Cupriavidus basilensis]